MIRPLHCTVLLVALSAALPSVGAVAQNLYKWVEADGSITFSADPPEHGVDYETVTSMTDDLSKDESVPATQPVTQPVTQPAAGLDSQPLQRSTSGTTLGSTTLGSTSRAGVTATELADPTVSRVAPMKDEKMGITAADNDAVTLPDAPAAGAAIPAERTPVISSVSTKQRQCEDLKKRVISLERRLKTRLTPEDMDNTVVHMARYQRSYDQYCVQ